MVTTNLRLDNRRKTKKAIYQIKIRITSDRVQKYYQTNFFASEQEYADLKKSSLSKKNREIRTQLDYLELKAKRIVQELPFFSFSGFAQAFYNTSYTKLQTLESLYSTIIEDKLKNESISTALSYRNGFKILKSFKSDVNFSDITPAFLKSCEVFMLNQGKSITTVGIYYRTLKAVLNIAIEKNLFPKENYPFGKGKYIIPVSANPKRALTMAQLKSIFEYKPAGYLGTEDRSKDFWIFSYLCNGMNIKDILLLKKKDISGDFLYFTREKTKYNNSQSNRVEVALLDEAKAIIDKWKCKDLNNPFLFPFIIKDTTSEEIYKIVQQFIKTTNKYMKAIGNSLHFKDKITTYWARHSFSKALMDSGQNISYISQCLNHKKITTTQSYLNSFEDYKKHDIATKALLGFIVMPKS